MARWKLTEPHYLSVPGTYWEQVSTDRITQRPVRRQFPVPLHLDPRLKDDWNYDVDGGPLRPDDMDGIIVVCHEGKGLPKDKIFIGDPTPGMFPLDAEAEAISAKFNWTPTQNVSDGYNPDDTSHQAKILAGLTKQLADAMVSGSAVAVPQGFEKMMESMAAMMQQQTMLLASMMERLQMSEFDRQAQAAGATKAEDEPALPDAEEPTAEEIAAAVAEVEAMETAQAAKESGMRAEAERKAAKGLRRV